eukprot:483182-Amphidinium_carterae.1
MGYEFDLEEVNASGSFYDLDFLRLQIGSSAKEILLPHVMRTTIFPNCSNLSLQPSRTGGQRHTSAI